MTKPEKHQARCDVVVVNYNAGEFLERCIESVLRSDVTISLMLVDNASTDDSLERVRNLSSGPHQFRIIENTENLGFSAAVNIGAGPGTSPFVLLLNPDCEIHPHTIGNLLVEATGVEDMGIMGALVFNEDGTEQRGCRRLEPTFTRSMVTALRLGKYFQSVNLQHDDLPAEPQSIDAVSGASMLIDRAVFDALSGMDEGYFLHVEDLDICRRVREFGKKVYFTPNVSLFHHHGASSHSVPYKTEWYKHQGMLRYQEKFQKPYQSTLRSLLTRGVVYVNFALSIIRQHLVLKAKGEPKANYLISNKKPVIITGATSDLGRAVLNQLKHDSPVLAVSRGCKFPAKIGNENWLCWSYFEKVPLADFKGARAWIALSPVWSAPEMASTLVRFGKLEKLISMSSTSISGKADTTDAQEQAIVERLVEGERSLLEWGESENLDITICRASMIYGGQQNKNIVLVKRLIRVFRFFPMLSRGNGLRQPVHVDDLAIAVNTLLRNPKQPQAIYTLAGGEQLSYRRMVERIFISQRQKPRFWVISESIFNGLLNVLSIFPGMGFLNHEMIKRMEQDLVYDIEPARRDFEYAPGMFRPGQSDKVK